MGGGAAADLRLDRIRTAGIEQPHHLVRRVPLELVLPLSHVRLHLPPVVQLLQGVLRPRHQLGPRGLQSSA